MKLFGAWAARLMAGNLAQSEVIARAPPTSQPEGIRDTRQFGVPHGHMFTLSSASASANSSSSNSSNLSTITINQRQAAVAVGEPAPVWTTERFPCPYAGAGVCHR